MTDPAKSERKPRERISVQRVYRERSQRTRGKIFQTGEEFFQTSPFLPKGD